MEDIYKGRVITTAVYNRPSGVSFTPRAVLSIGHGSSQTEMAMEWPNQCDTKVEAEKLAIQLARSTIDDGAGAI